MSAEKELYPQQQPPDDAAAKKGEPQCGDPAKGGPKASPWELAFGSPRNFLANQFVYLVLSSRAKGLCVGVDLTPDRRCNFDCLYCEINRKAPLRAAQLNIDKLIVELEATLRMIYSKNVRTIPGFDRVPEEFLKLRHVAISGDGEPSLCPKFEEAIQAIVHLRALNRLPYFKLVFLTNASMLHKPNVQSGLALLGSEDEIWAKLDAGDEETFQRINRPQGVSFDQVVANIVRLGTQRPIVIQSLFAQYRGHGPSEQHIELYVKKLKELKDAGVKINLVQIYSASRPTVDPNVQHLSLPELSAIASKVRKETGLRAEVY